MKLLHGMAPYNLFGLEDQSYDSAKVVAIPVPYDSTTSYRAGAREGPRAIISASRAIELYSEELGWNPSKIGIFTTEELEPDIGSPERTVKRIAREAGLVLADGKMPLILGGEHTVALGAIEALAETNRDFSVVHFDAHADSRQEFMGSKFSHACVAARARELANRVYSVGVRSIDEESASKHAKDILYMKDMRRLNSSALARRIAANTSKDVYITIDLDVLDPSEMPSVGTPEPDGMRFRQLVDVIALLLKSKRLLGLDVTELSPLPGNTAPDYLAAKLIYLVIGNAFIGEMSK